MRDSMDFDGEAFKERLCATMCESDLLPRVALDAMDKSITCLGISERLRGMHEQYLDEVEENNKACHISHGQVLKSAIKSVSKCKLLKAVITVSVFSLGMAVWGMDNLNNLSYIGSIEVPASGVHLPKQVVVEGVQKAIEIVLFLVVSCQFATRGCKVLLDVWEGVKADCLKSLGGTMDNETAHLFLEEMPDDDVRYIFENVVKRLKDIDEDTLLGRDDELQRSYKYSLYSIFTLRIRAGSWPLPVKDPKLLQYFFQNTLGKAAAKYRSKAGAFRLVSYKRSAKAMDDAILKEG